MKQSISFISALRRHQARVSITQPTVRSQGPGTLHTAWAFLSSDLDLRRLRASSERKYLVRLDDATVLDHTRSIMEAGGSGVIFGRNVWQREWDDALEIIAKIKETLLASVKRVP